MREAIPHWQGEDQMPAMGTTIAFVKDNLQ